MKLKSNFFKVFLIIMVFATIIYLIIVYTFYNHKKKLLEIEARRNIMRDVEQINKDMKTYLNQSINFTRQKKNILDEKKVRICEKWIILTTINQPTDDVKYINDASYGWCVLVVGDKKTPSNWNYKDVFYLDVKTQVDILSKKFKIIQKIPFNSYLRKMAGYLYAIDKKAKYIYETDDDNSPLDGLFGFRYEKFKGLESDCKANNLFINPYNYFGQPSTWPRFIINISFFIFILIILILVLSLKEDIR
jgi:hypothetical protein